MTFFPEPIRPSEGREDDEYRVNPIEADRHSREEFDTEGLKERERKKRMNLYGAFLLHLKKRIDNFDLSTQEPSKTISNETLLRNLKEFRSLLETIQELDQSEDISFCQHLSETWIHLLQDVHISSISKRRQSINLEALSLLMEAISHYPKNEEHKLGYYLSNYAGKAWFPLPFQDILKSLHSDHALSPKNSTLSQWVQMIENLLQT